MMKSLEAVIEQIDGYEELDTSNVFAVIDLDTAAEAQRRVAYFEEKKKEIDAIIEKQIAPFMEKIEKIKMWGHEAKFEYEEKQAYYSNHLEQYLRSEVAKQMEAGKNPKKTLSLPYGKISLKKQQPKFEKDEKALFEYAKTAGFVRVKEETDWMELKKNCVVAGGKLYDQSGEAVPGITVIEQGEKFEIKLD